MARTVGRIRRSPIRRESGSLPAVIARRRYTYVGLQITCRRRYCYRFATVLVWEKHVLCVNSEHIALPVNFSAICFPWRWERTEGGQSPPPSVLPGSGRQNRHFVVPSTYPGRLRVGPRQRPCKSRPSARIHAGCPGLPGTSQRF